MARVVEFPEETFSAMRRIRETALVQFDSLFAPGNKIWSLQHLRRFHQLFVERFDEGEGLFLPKWRKQLDGADDDVLQLAAELLYVQQFFTSVTGPEKKLDTAKPSTPLGSSRGGDLAPRLHGRGSEDSVRAGGGEMALNIEGVVGGRVE